MFSHKHLVASRTGSRQKGARKSPKPASVDTRGGALFESLENRQLMSAVNFDAGFGVEGTVQTTIAGDVQKVVAQTDGKLVVLTTDGRIARFTNAGALDKSFSPGGNDGDGILAPIGLNDPTNYLPDRQTFRDIALTAGNKLVITGSQEINFNQDQLLVERLKTDGTLDTTFNGTGKVVMGDPFRSNATVAGQSVIVDTAGRIVVSNHNVAPGGIAYVETDHVYRFNTNGSRDGGFDPRGLLIAGTAQPYSGRALLSQSADGSYTVIQDWLPGNAVYSTRITADGAFVACQKTTLDFAGSGVSSAKVTSMAMASDNGFVLSGSTVRQGMTQAFTAKLNSSLQLDGSFYNANRGGASTQVRRVMLQGLGQVMEAVTSGRDPRMSGVSLQRLNRDGTQDSLDRDVSAPTSMPLNSGDAVMLNNGKIVFAGSYDGKITLSKILNDVGSVSGSVKVNGTGVGGMMVYDDVNNNGVRDSGEGIAVTRSDGTYNLIGLGTGDHVIRQVPRTGFAQVTPNNGGGRSVTINANSIVDDTNFNNVPATGQIAGWVYNDLNGNGSQQAGEGALVGQRVYIDRNNNGWWDAGEQFSISDSTGWYQLPSLLAGQYRVRMQTVGYYHQTAPRAFSDQLITLTDGQQNNYVLWGAAFGGEPVIDAEVLGGNAFQGLFK